MRAAGGRAGRACLLLTCLLAAAGLCWRPETASAGRPARPGPVSITGQENGGFIVEAAHYRALVSADGNLHSLRVQDVEMIDDRVGISLGSFFYADGPRRLPQVERRSDGSVSATDGTYAIRYRFGRDHLRIALENRGGKPAPYFIVLSPSIAIATRAGTAEAAAVPANERWGDVRFSAQSGAYLELTGGSRIWGPWLGRQVWEAAPAPPGVRREITLRVGTGPAPAATLEQLIGLQATALPDGGIVPAGAPLELVVTVENRSTKDVQASLSVELSACRGDVVIYSAAPVEIPAQRLVEKPFRWQVSAPDFYSMSVSTVVGGRQVGRARAAAGYRVSEILPLVGRPPDFDDFWQRLVDEAESDPPQVRVRRDDRLSRRGIEVSVAQYDSLAGKTIHGWYAAPAGARSRPAILYLSGYGARPVEPPIGLARKGWVVLAIDVRGNEVDRVRPRPFEDYLTEGITSPNSYVYREIVGHALRALAALGTREEVDPERIAVVGVSEGGGLGILLAALSPSVRAVAADAPLLVDFPLSMRVAGWPYAELARHLQQRPHERDQALETLAYFDAASFAPQVRCPVLLGVGLLDRVSLPAAVWGLYNVLPEPKEIRLFPRAGHEGGGEDHWAYKLEWLAGVLGAAPAP